MHYDSPVGRTIDLFGLVPALANLSARQAKAADLMTSGTCGRHGTTSSASEGLSLSLASKLQAKTGSLGSTLFTLTWKLRATPLRRSIYALRASVRRTSANDFSSWPTPTTRDWKDGSSMHADVPMNALLGRVAWLAGWPTPTAREFIPKDLEALERRRAALAQAQGNNGFGLTLGQAAPLLAGWPTPTASLATKGGPNAGRGPCGSDAQPGAGPSSSSVLDGLEHSSRGGCEATRLHGGGGGSAIGERQTSVGRGPSELSRPGPVNGYWANADWLFCRDDKWRPVEPGAFPLVAGAPARVGRLRGYGNAINPWVAASFIKAYLTTKEEAWALAQSKR